MHILKNKTSEKLIFQLAKLAQEVNKNELSLFLFDKLTNKYPASISYWGGLGNACNDLNLLNKAMVAYKRANILANSKEVWILENIGNLLKNQDFYADARIYFNESLSLDANSEYSFTRIASIIKLEEEENEHYSKLLKEGLNVIVDQISLLSSITIDIANHTI